MNIGKDNNGKFILTDLTLSEMTYIYHLINMPHNFFKQYAEAELAHWKNNQRFYDDDFIKETIRQMTQHIQNGRQDRWDLWKEFDDQFRIKAQ